MTCLTPNCTAPANHTLRCPDCLQNLWTWSARGWQLPMQETPPRQWSELTDEERRRI